MKKGVVVGVACLSMCAVLGGVVQHSQLDAKAAKSVESQAVATKGMVNVTMEDINVPLSTTFKETMRSDGSICIEVMVKNESDRDVTIINPIFAFKNISEDYKENDREEAIVIPVNNVKTISFYQQYGEIGNLEDVMLVKYQTIYNGKYYTVVPKIDSHFESFSNIAESVREKVDFDDKDILEFSFNNDYCYDEELMEAIPMIEMKNNSNKKITRLDIEFDIYDKNGESLGTGYYHRGFDWELAGFDTDIINPKEKINVEVNNDIEAKNLRKLIGHIEVTSYNYSTVDQDKNSNNSFEIFCKEKMALGYTYLKGTERE